MRGRRRGVAAAAITTTVLLVLPSCGGGRRSYVLTETSTPSTTTSSPARPSSSGARPPTTARRSTNATAATPTTATPVGSAAPRSTTTHSDRCPVARAGAPDATVPDGVVTTSTLFGLRIAHPADWPVTDVRVPASEVLDPRTLPLVGLNADTALSPLAMRAASAYPGIAIFRFQRPQGIDLVTLTEMMREFQSSRHFAMTNQTLAGCFDGEVAAGVSGTTTRVLEVVWLTFHADSFYVVACLAKDDGIPTTQNEVTAIFQHTLDTLRWLP
jgi:hypothetical protein